MQQNRYDLQIFLSSTFDQGVMRDVREAFRNEINARLNNILGLLGSNAYVVDMQLGIPKGTDALRTLEICLERICDSNCFVFVLSDTYGRQNTRAFLMGDPPVAIERVDASPFAQTIRAGMEQELYIIELEALQAEQVTQINGNRLFFFDQKIQAEGEPYTARIMGDLTKKHGRTETIFRFETAGDIKEAFIRFFEQRFQSECSKLDSRQQDQNALTAAAMRYYVENKEGIAALESYRTSDSREAFLLAGESGSGKSALLLDWISRIEPPTKVIACFVNYKRNSLREVLADLYRQQPFPDTQRIVLMDEVSIVEQFYPFLRALGSGGPTVVVIDGLDQLRRDHGASPYAWLPRVLPNDVKLVLSTNEPVDFKGLVAHEVPRVDTMEILKQMLKCEGKELETETIADALRISAFQATDLPVFARILYQEIIEHFHYDDIQEKLVEHLKQTGTPERLVLAFLRRLSARFSETVVKESLALIHCAQYGLTLEDLQALVRDPRVDELVYMLNLEFRVDNLTRMTFYHRYFTDAIYSQFCLDEAFMRQCRLNIFDWFAAKKPNGASVMEAAHQLFALGDQDRMLSYLADFKTASILFAGSPYQDAEGDADPYRVLQITSIFSDRTLLLNQWRKQKIGKESLLWLAIFAAMAERYGEARKLFSKVLKRDLAPGRRTLAHEWVAKTFHGLGDYEAEERFRQISQSWEKRENKDSSKDHAELLAADRAFFDNPTAENRAAYLQASESDYGLDSVDLGIVLHNIASHISRHGDLDQAIQDYLRALPIFEETYGERHTETVQVYHNLASVYAQKGDFDEAIRYFNMALPVMRERLGRLHPELGALYNNLGGLHYLRGEYSAALEYLRSAHGIYKAQFGRSDPQTKEVWKNIGLVSSKMHFAHT